MGNNFIRRNLKAINILELISAAAVLNKEDKLIELLAFAKKRKIRRTMIYESLLQTYLFAGIPSALISLKIFKDIFPQNNTRNKNSSKNFRLEGIKNCRKIYGNKFDKLIFNTKTFSPELAEILVNDGYGKILGRKELNLKDRELCIISILSAMKFENQLYSHIYGAYRLNIKADKVFEAIKIIDLIDGKNRSNFGINVLNKYLMNKG